MRRSRFVMYVTNTDCHDNCAHMNLHICFRIALFWRHIIRTEICANICFQNEIWDIIHHDKHAKFNWNIRSHQNKHLTKNFI